MPAKETDQTQSRERRSLTGVASAGAADVLVQESVAPVVRDDWPDGFDYVCGHCGEMVLASCVADDQLWDLGFQCFACKGVSMSPPLPAGMALPPQTVLVTPGLSPITGTIELRRVVLVGKPAVDRRQSEAGPRGGTFGSLAKRPPPPPSDANHLERIVEDVRRLLGAKFNTLELSDQRGRESPTPPKKRHPLTVAVQSIRAAIATFATPTPTVDVRPVMELVTLLHTLERWKRHPFWPRMVQGLDDEYLHTVITLATATALEDAGNGVVFQETTSERAPDLLLVVGAQRRAAVEVKVPEVLRGPDGALGYDKLLEVVERAMKGARTGAKGQLSRRQPALLVIGGFYLAPSDLNDFKRAATDYLQGATRRGRHAHTMGIALISFGTAITRGTTTSDVRGMLQLTVAENPGYRGEVFLKST